MAFFERDETDSWLVQARDVFKAWFRAIFVEDWALKLLALFISIGLWWGVTGQRKQVTVRLEGVQLSYRLPANMEISNDPRREVEVTLTGAELLLERINTHDLVGFVNVSDLEKGDRIVTLNRDRVTMGLPGGVRIDDIEPSTVTVSLEPRIESSVSVEPKYLGEPADGFEVRDVKVTPEHVRIRGPQSHVNALRSVPTEPIQISGLSASFSKPEIAVDSTDRKVNVLDPLVSVSVEIGEKRVEKIFSGVPVFLANGSRPSPQTASVKLFGTRIAVNNLQVSDLKIVLVEGDDGTLVPRLSFTKADNPEVELHGTIPAKFSAHDQTK